MKKLIVLCLSLLFIATGCSLSKNASSKNLTLDQAKIKAEKFINKDLMRPGSKAVVKKITEDNGLYKLSVDIGRGKDIDSYISKDGKKFFPQVINIEKMEKQIATKNNSKQQKNKIIKTDKPSVELFVMSYCPYGTQIEKGILPVLETLGNKIKFNLKFCDYSMHGKKELDEELRQYCIQKNEPSKLISYLKCFLNDKNYNGCIKSVHINSIKLKNCISETDKKFKVTKNFNNKSTWSNGRFPGFNIYKKDNDKYGIQGSPSLVINGNQVSSGRDSSSLLKLICSTFKKQPKECSKKLSSVSPSPGFGFKKGGSSTNAKCN